MVKKFEKKNSPDTCTALSPSEFEFSDQFGTSSLISLRRQTIRSVKIQIGSRGSI